MNITKVRCIRCGNMQKVDLNKPFKTGRRAEPPYSAYLMFRCEKCESMTRVVLAPPTSRSYPVTKIPVIAS